MFFLPYAYHVVAFCLSLLFILLFVLLFVVYLFLFCVSSVSLPGDNVFAGYFPARFLLSAFHLFLSGYVRGSVWFGSIYLVTTARFVADQSM